MHLYICIDAYLDLEPNMVESRQNWWNLSRLATLKLPQGIILHSVRCSSLFRGNFWHLDWILGLNCTVLKGLKGLRGWRGPASLDFKVDFFCIFSEVWKSVQAKTLLSKLKLNYSPFHNSVHILLDLVYSVRQFYVYLHNALIYILRSC